jgi:hypothetical protein
MVDPADAVDFATDSRDVYTQMEPWLSDSRYPNLESTSTDTA